MLQQDHRIIPRKLRILRENLRIVQGNPPSLREDLRIVPRKSRRLEVPLRGRRHRGPRLPHLSEDGRLTGDGRSPALPIDLTEVTSIRTSVRTALTFLRTVRLQVRTIRTSERYLEPGLGPSTPA